MTRACANLYINLVLFLSTVGFIKGPSLWQPALSFLSEAGAYSHSQACSAAAWPDAPRLDTLSDLSLGT